METTASIQEIVPSPESSATSSNQMLYSLLEQVTSLKGNSDFDPIDDEIVEQVAKLRKQAEVSYSVFTKTICSNPCSR